jgi:hypothetical protein
MNGIFSGSQVTPNTEVLVNGRCVLRARTSLGFRADINQG